MTMADEALLKTFVSELEETSQLNDDDLFLLSQKLESSSGYSSKSISYDVLKDQMLVDIDDKVDSRIELCAGQAFDDIAELREDVDELSGTVMQNVSATIKMANCIQKNKADIGAIQTTISGMADITGQNGIAVDKTNAGWKIKHTNSVASLTEPAFAKLKYDAQGHITGKSDVTIDDILALDTDGQLLPEIGEGLTKDGEVLKLSAASTEGLGGIKLGYTAEGTKHPLEVDISSRAYVDIPTPAQYEAGEGIDKTGNTFSLKEATSLSLGGIKLGAQQEGNAYPLLLNQNGVAYVSVDWVDTTYSYADAANAGVILANGQFSRDNYHPVQVSSNGFAYVDISVDPLTGDIDIPSSRVATSSDHALITALKTDNGCLVDLSTSTVFYNEFENLSSRLFTLNIPLLSNQYLREISTEIEYDQNNSYLRLKSNGSTVSQTQINIPTLDSITACTYVTSYNEDEDEDEALSGSFLEFSTSEGGKFWTDIGPLVDQIVDHHYFQVIDTIPEPEEADSSILYIRAD